jgi:hypothetical protein
MLGQSPQPGRWSAEIRKQEMKGGWIKGACADEVRVQLGAVSLGPDPSILRIVNRYAASSASEPLRHSGLNTQAEATAYVKGGKETVHFCSFCLHSSGCHMVDCHSS